MNIRTLLFLGAAMSAASGLAACDNGPSAVSTRDRAAGAPQRYETAQGPREDSGARDGFTTRTSRRREASSQDNDLGGGLTWAANSRHSADDNAHYQFEHRAADFGLADFKAFVSKADAFVSHPPEGVLKVERANGDVLMYDPKTNIFAVADKTGAPRTMFKPSEGAAYWDAQKSKSTQRRRRERDDSEKS